MEIVVILVSVICYEIRINQHMCILCGQNVEYFSVKRGYTWSNHWSL